MVVKLSKLSSPPVSRCAEHRAQMGQFGLYSGPRRRKWDIALTIRGAFETYDGFVITLLRFITTPGPHKKQRIHLLKTRTIGHTGVTFFRAKFLLLRAFVREPVLARRETEFCTKKGKTEIS